MNQARKRKKSVHAGLGLLALLIILPFALGAASDIIKTGTLEVSASGMDVLGYVNATGDVKIASGNLNSGALLIGGASTISSARVGNFAAGTTVGGQGPCLADGTNCPVSSDPWRNSTAQVSLVSNATNVSIGYVSSQPVLFIDNTNGKVGTGTTTPTTALHVTGNLNVTGNITAGDMIEVPVGAIVPFVGSTVPNGWLIANGSMIPNATYGRLCAMLGATYGASNGSHCALPDLRQRFPLGRAASGTGSTLGGTGGSINHTHTGPSHTHGAGTLTQTTHTHSAGSYDQPTHTHTDGSYTQTTHTHGDGSYDQPTHQHTPSTSSTSTGNPDSAHTHGDVTNSLGSTGTETRGHTHVYQKATGSSSSGGQVITGTSGSGGNDAITGSTAADGGDAPTGATASGGNDAITGSTAANGTDATGMGSMPFITVNYLIKT